MGKNSKKWLGFLLLGVMVVVGALYPTKILSTVDKLGLKDLGSKIGENKV